jgi:hypothetical protein
LAAGRLCWLQEKQNAEEDCPMQISSEIRQSPDNLSERHAAEESATAKCESHKLVLRILKLRWMGMEDEAEIARITLRKVEPAATMLAGPFDTD